MPFESLAKFCDLIKVIANPNYCDNLKSYLVKFAPDEFIISLSELFHNVLLGNIKLTSTEVQKLKPYKTPIHIIANPDISIAKRRKQLCSNIELLTAILPKILH